MEHVEVEILIQTITGRYGTLNPPRRLRTDAAFAAHLVDDCGAARYVTEEKLGSTPEVEGQAQARTRTGPKKKAAPIETVQTSAQESSTADSLHDNSRPADETTGRSSAESSEPGDLEQPAE